jgi:GT2 family glycosyltransferase
MYPRTVLERLGGFREELGRKGASLLGCEETYLERQIRAAGMKIVYEPAMIVGHHIHAERLTRWWRYRRAYWQGASLAMCDLLTEPMEASVRRRKGIRRAAALLIPPVRTILLGMIGRRSIAEWFYGYSVRAGYAAGLIGVHQFQIQTRGGGEHEADVAGK